MGYKTNSSFMIAQDFKTDVSKIDIEQLLQPKLWACLEVDHPEFIMVEYEIRQWLKHNTPAMYALAVENSKRKAFDKLLINAVKAKLVMEQQGITSLRVTPLDRFAKLFNEPIDNTLKTLIRNHYKNHDVEAQFIHRENNSIFANIDPIMLYIRYGESKRIKPLLAKQPNSVYLNLINNLCDETLLLNKLCRSVAKINPPSRS